MEKKWLNGGTRRYGNSQITALNNGRIALGLMIKGNRIRDTLGTKNR